MAVLNAVFCGPAHAGPCAKQAGAEKRGQKLEDQEQDDADDACSQRHHLDGSVDGVLHGTVGLRGHRYKGVTNIISYVRYASAKPYIFGGFTKKIIPMVTFSFVLTSDWFSNPFY